MIHGGLARGLLAAGSEYRVELRGYAQNDKHSMVSRDPGASLMSPREPDSFRLFLHPHHDSFHITVVMVCGYDDTIIVGVLSGVTLGAT